MDHITIPIPEGMDATQKAELTQWLSKRIAEATPDRLPLEDDPDWQAETTQRIKRGMEEIKAGLGRPAKEGLRQIADELGVDLDR